MNKRKRGDEEFSMLKRRDLALIDTLNPKELSDVFGFDGRELQRVIHNLENNFTKMHETADAFVVDQLKQLKALDYEIVDELPKRNQLVDRLYIKKNGRNASGANGMNLLECSFNKKPVAVKIPFKQGDDPDELLGEIFYESLIGIFMSTRTSSIPEINAPYIYKIGSIPEKDLIGLKPRRLAGYQFFPTQPVIIQEFIPGKTLGDRLDNVNERNMKNIFNNLFLGFAKLQKTLAFSHRDMHSENIMVDRNDNIFIIDFGYSCITMPPQPNVDWKDLPDGIQKHEGGYRWNQDSDEAIRKCLNFSHDICTLMLSLRSNKNVKSYYGGLMIDISNEYKRRLLQILLDDNMTRYQRKIISSTLRMTKSILENYGQQHPYYKNMYDQLLSAVKGKYEAEIAWGGKRKTISLMLGFRTTSSQMDEVSNLPDEILDLHSNTQIIDHWYTYNFYSFNIPKFFPENLIDRKKPLPKGYRENLSNRNKPSSPPPMDIVDGDYVKIISNPPRGLTVGDVGIVYEVMGDNVYVKFIKEENNISKTRMLNISDLVVISLNEFQITAKIKSSEAVVLKDDLINLKF